MTIPFTLLAQPDGSIVAGGESTKRHGQPHYHLTRFIPHTLNLGVPTLNVNGVLTLKLSGTAQTNAVIEATSTFSPGNWRAIWTNTPCLNASTFSDPDSAKLPRRFYRAVARSFAE